MNPKKRRQRAKRVKKATSGNRKKRPGSGGHHQVNEKTFKLGFRYEQAGKLKAAENCYRKFLLACPDEATAHYNLGNVLLKQNRPDDAAVSFQQAITLNPDEASGYINLGNIFYIQGKTDEAATCYIKALAINPENANIYINLSNIYNKQNNLDQAIASLQRAVAINPHNPEVYLNLGHMFQKQKRMDDAVEAFRSVLEIDPENDSAGHLLSALTGKKTEAAPRRYVKDVFSRLSNNFEKHLVNKLGYSVPRVFRETLEKLSPGKVHFRNVLDLGCGTGLSGIAFGDISDRMTGVDLSSEMLEKASEKNIYDDLSEWEIVDFLKSTSQKYDLIIVADVLIYIGNLNPIFESIVGCLDRNAYFIFSTESTGGSGYQLLETGRYAHSREYIETLAGDHFFDIKKCDSVGIRKEHGKWIMGDIFVLMLSYP